jgi:hypothetical protein
MKKADFAAYFKQLYNQRRAQLCSVPDCQNAMSIDDIEMDHVDPSDKIKEVSAFAWWASTMDRARQYKHELNKTAPLCTHHHRLKTSRERQTDDNYDTARRRRAKEMYYHQRKLDFKHCYDCRRSVTDENYYMFDFDHKSPVLKTKACSQLKYGSRERLEQEIYKCNLLCVQCHKAKTRRKTVQSKYFV